MATWSSSYITGLPDSAFACVQGKDRFYPHHDASGALDLPHLRAALSRIGDPSNQQCGKSHLEAHAKAEQMGQGKALMPIKAQGLDDDEQTAWFAGRLPRRLLAIPFGGPIPSVRSAKGVDLDGEFFTERTDIFGPYPELRRNRERLTDFHHSAKPPSNTYGDPTGMMRGTFIGKSILDPDPEEDGWWVDFWFAAGEKRVGLIAKLAERGAQLFGSSQPIGNVAKAANGEITVWPYWLQTISPSPQNTYSVIRPKAALDALTAEPDRFWSGIEESLRSLGRSLRESSDDRALIEAKAGRVFSATNETDILAALDDFEAAAQRVRDVLARQTKLKEEPDDSGTH